MPNEDQTEPGVPADLLAALAAAPLAEAAWRDLTPIGRRDFLGWIQSAKQAETRSRRIRIACENIAAGKRRPCCYSVIPLDLYKLLWEAPAAKAGWSNLTASEKRDYSEWVEASEDSETRKSRVVEACARLAAGKRRPRPG
ncbi:MAG TPA: YdeI/OmpD-associated family protein [Fimbriimonadaceae bacterium]|nr:YdeI/OmpD-associated family protein [Fimbriimonadaceae bacterium]